MPPSAVPARGCRRSAGTSLLRGTALRLCLWAGASCGAAGTPWGCGWHWGPGRSLSCGTVGSRACPSPSGSAPPPASAAARSLGDVPAALPKLPSFRTSLIPLLRGPTGPAPVGLPQCPKGPELLGHFHDLGPGFQTGAGSSALQACC